MDEPEKSEPAGDAKAPITIKKYANRRLYNTATSSYVTLDHLCQMVKEGVDFAVYDAKTGEDITRSVLTQIIVEEEGKGQNLLPLNFLRQIISLYGDNLQFLVPRYLEHTMESFARNQEQMRKAMQDSFGNIMPGFGKFEELGKQNLAMFERAMRIFNPFQMPTAGGNGTGAPTAAKSGEPPAGEALDELKTRLDALQREIAALGGAKPGGEKSS